MGLVERLENNEHNFWDKNYYDPVVYLSTNHREEYIDKYRKCVDDILPKIEERADIELGPVLVKDERYYINDQINHIFASDLKKSGKKGKLVFDLVKLVGNSIYSFLKDKNVPAMYNSNTATIYVDVLGNINRKRADPNLFFIEEVVKHELMHHLWYGLGGEVFKSKISKFWSEGFATFGEIALAKDICPKTMSFEDIMSRVPLDYKCGFYMVQKTVQKYGPDIFLEIPKRWVEFTEDFRKTETQ